MSKPTQSPIAIVGLGCRFPGGAHDPERYLQFLEEAGDGVVEVPTDRWSADLHHDPDPGSAGRTHVNRGGFLQQDIYAFDAAFFGISPREAATIDPQQRLLLEVTQEAFEDAGLPAAQLSGSETGVFVGGFTLDNMIARFAPAQVDQIDNHTATSSSMTLLAARLSYAFDLRGPAMTVDTACSSSLVAVHLACEALRSGDCAVALAGGVNVMLLPYYQIVMSKGHFLAADGRCKTFEAGADGYGRGEGAGVVVLKRLDQALADGDRIHAVIRGTGTNQDGATDGIPMPNPDAQAQLIARTCERAGIDPRSVGYVEAHGTGTRAGDPIECSALAKVYGADREAPLPVGSVKANFGHLEAAAGIAGLIKATLSVRERRILPHRPLGSPNPDIDFEAIRVPQASESWPVEGVARAGVNSFGYGGTNAHVILEQPPERPIRGTPRGTGPRLLPVSARSPEALSETARRLADRAGALELDALRGAQAHRRSHHPVRAAVLASSASQAREGLEALSTGETAPGLIQPRETRSGLVWVYTGMGPQWWAMGQELYATEPIFQRAVDQVAERFELLAGWSILEHMLREESASEMPRNEIAQPANLVLQVGLTALLRAWGPAPDAILGHSVGEVAAAWASGSLALSDAVLVAVHRSRLQQRAAGLGGMLAIACRPDEVPRLVGGREDVVIAAYNSPEMVTLAGPEDGLEEVAMRCAAEDRFAKGVRVEVPYHSPAMDPLKDELLASLANLSPQAPKIPLYSTMTGTRVRRAVHDGMYWWRNTRQAVMLQQATEAALDDGHELFLEVGPHPVLGGSIQATMRGRGARGSTLYTQRRKQPERATLMQALGGLYTHGLDLSWSRLAPEGAPVPLPTTPWQRRRHWAESEAAAERRTGDTGRHPLRLQRTGGPEGDSLSRLDRLGWLTDHKVDGTVVLPGAAMVEAMLAELPADEEAVLQDLRFERAAVLDADAPTDLAVRREEGRLTVHTRRGEEPWQAHASARWVAGGSWKAPAPLDVDALRAACTESVDIEALYASLADRGLDYGPAFRGVRSVWRSGEEVVAELALAGPDAAGWRLHPALLDAGFQLLVAAIGERAGRRTVMPVRIRRVWSRGAAGEQVLAHLRLTTSESEAWEGDLTLARPDGTVVARVIGLRVESVGGARESDWTHTLRWAPVALEATPPTEIALYGDDGFAEEVAEQLTGRVSLHREPLTPPAGSLVLCVPASDPADPMGVGATHQVLDALARARAVEGARFAVLTRCGATQRDQVDPAHAAVAGLVRVAATEHPELAPVLVDVDPTTLDRDALIDGLLRAPGGEELALYGSTWHGLRVERTRTRALEPAGAPRPVSLGDEPMALEVLQPGRLDSLAYRGLSRRAPSPTEVEVEVEVASLNFKDVMKAMGMLSDVALENAFLGRGLGLEAAGRIVRVGEAVEGLSVGDRVFVYQGGSVRSHLLVDQHFAVPCPEGMDPVEGACVFVFLTAWYALVHAGRVMAGETVLIHSAAGGVGLAALQIARHRGAEVIATAGTPEKRQLLRELGVEHVFDSRTLDFADEVRAVTDGRGVDAVLNALAGPALVASLDLCAPGGRFLELGKRDIAANQSLGMLPFNRALSFIAIDLDRMATEKPAWFGPVAREVMAAFADGILEPLPTEVYAADQTQAAFRDLASGNRIGKVAIDLRCGEVELLPARRVPIAGTWLVTGGLGGFGLRSAEWLADQGADHLVLASRRGEAREAEQPAIDALRADGVKVDTLALDVTDAEAVRRAVDGLDRLDGVLHAAMVLADRPLAELDREALDTAMGAKALGAWNLHRATAHRPLDHFVMYGSISAWVGNPGQGAYAAANAALDGLAAARVARGLPALAVSWGAIDDVGVVARDSATRTHLASLGLHALDPAVGLDVLAGAMPLAPASLAVVDIDWDRYARAVPGCGWSRLESLVQRAGEAGAEGPVERLLQLDPAERRAAVLQTLLGLVATAFRMAPEQVDRSRSLRDQGLDSIVALELGMGIEEDLGVEISAMDLLAGRSVEALAERVLAALGAETAPEAPEREVGVEEGPEQLLEKILVGRPYLSLEELALDEEAVLGTVVPDRPDASERAAMPAAEVGRHLAILGSLAAARTWAPTTRHAWPVAEARLSLPDDLDPDAWGPGTRFSLEARCTGIDRTANRASATGVARAPDGTVVGTLEVTYHVIEASQLRTLFAEHTRLTRADGNPYDAPMPELGGTWDGTLFRRSLPPIEAEDCAGHFPGLPAMPVSILGRHVLAVALDAQRHALGRPDLGARVRRCDLVTERFAWAGEAVAFTARPLDEGWEVAVQTEAGEPVARFAIELELEPARRQAMSAK